SRPSRWRVRSRLRRWRSASALRSSPATRRSPGSRWSAPPHASRWRKGVYGDAPSRWWRMGMDTAHAHDDHLKGALESEDEYLLGHSAHELGRLSAQAQLYAPFILAFLRAAGIAAGMRVLDVGCGGGDVSVLVAHLVGPTGEVVGIDRSAAAVEAASR